MSPTGSEAGTAAGTGAATGATAGAAAEAGAETAAALARRLALLEARAGVEDLMQRYAAAADAKHEALRRKAAPEAMAAAAAAQAACFAEDAEWQAGGFGGALQGRAAIEGFFRHSPWRFTAHHYGSPRFDVLEAGHASLSWRLLEIGIREDSGRVHLMTGQVAQDCRLTPAGWHIARMEFTALHAIALAADPEALRCLIPGAEGF